MTSKKKPGAKPKFKEAMGPTNAVRLPEDQQKTFDDTLAHTGVPKPDAMRQAIADWCVTQGEPAE